MYTIFIIEDDPTIADSLTAVLTAWDYQVSCCQNFKAVMAAFQAAAPDLVLLDIGLPFYNGFYWCERIRQQSNVPIIFISSAADSLNIVTAINQGADDFVEKPFDSAVLVAKIQAQLRRAYDMTTAPSRLVYQQYQLNIGQLQFERGERHVELTKNELKILQTLIERAGQVVSRSALMHVLWDSDCFIDDNTLTVNVTRLRKKLITRLAADIIKTKKGVGYYLA